MKRLKWKTSATVCIRKQEEKLEVEVTFMKPVKHFLLSDSQHISSPRSLISPCSAGSAEGWTYWTWAWAWTGWPPQRLWTSARKTTPMSPTLPFPPTTSTLCLWLPSISWLISSSFCCAWWEIPWCVASCWKTAACAQSSTSSSSTWPSVTSWLASSASLQRWWTTSSQVRLRAFPQTIVVAFALSWSWFLLRGANMSKYDADTTPVPKNRKYVLVLLRKPLPQYTGCPLNC